MRKGLNGHRFRESDRFHLVSMQNFNRKQGWKKIQYFIHFLSACFLLFHVKRILKRSIPTHKVTGNTCLAVWDRKSMRIGTGTRPRHCKRSVIRYPQCFRNVDTAYRTWALDKHICTLTCFPRGLEQIVEPAAELTVQMSMKFSWTLLFHLHLRAPHVERTR